MLKGKVKSIAISGKNGSSIFYAGKPVTERDVYDILDLVKRGHIELDEASKKKVKEEEDAKKKEIKEAAEKAKKEQEKANK